MKKLAALALTLVLVSVFGPCLPAIAEPAFTPHEDPSTTASTMDAYSFLIQYGDIFALMANKQYDNASRLSEQLSHITVSEDLTYVINRYNQLTQQLITTLNDLQTTLDKTSTLLDQYRLNEAAQTLNHAGISVAQAQILLGDLKDATTAFSQRLGIYAASTQTKVQQAYNQLENMLQTLNGLINQYHQLLQKANQRAQEIKTQNLQQPTITLTLNSSKCFVGDYVTVEGTLTTSMQPMMNRAVKLVLDGTEIASTISGADGTYRFAIKVPYKYVDSMTVCALYTPEGSDQGEYLAATSPTTQLRVQFYQTTLTFSAPNIAYPGLPLTVKGEVTSQDGSNNQRVIEVQLSDAGKTQVKTDQNGAFNATFTIDPMTPIGIHTLTVTVQPQNRYIGATQQTTVKVQKMATTLKVAASTFIVLPTQLQISGNVNSAAGPLKNVKVQVEFTNLSATTQTQDNGSFNLQLNIPLNVALAGYQELTVKAQPTQPWQATAQTQTHVFTLNSLSTGVAVASLLSVFGVMLMKFAKPKKPKETTVQIEDLTGPKRIENRITPAVVAIPKSKATARVGKILQVYVETLEAVQRTTGSLLMPDMTIREYAQKIERQLVDVAEDFFMLTRLAEKSLYASHQPQQEDLDQATNLADTVRRSLKNANT